MLLLEKFVYTVNYYMNHTTGNKGHDPLWIENNNRCMYT